MNVKKALSSTRRRIICGITLIGVSLAPWNVEAAADDVPRGDHGAATMEYQMKTLDRLAPVVDLSRAPAGFDPVVWQAFIPEDNALTPERVELGRKLYFEKRLSADATVACATCHDVTRGFTDQLPVSEGIRDQNGRRNAPTTLNVPLLQTVFLDGRSPTLEHQAQMPIVNPVEMGMPDGQAAVAAIQNDAEYKAAFQRAYGRPVNYEDIGRAIAAFERTLIFVDSPFRRFLAGDERAISPEAIQGWVLFNQKARCVSCHPMNTSNPLGDRQPLSQHRRLRPASGLRRPCKAGPEGVERGSFGTEARRTCVVNRYERVGPVHGDEEPLGYRGVSHLYPAEHRNHAPLHA